MAVRKKYPDDLLDEEWNLVESIFQTESAKGGRPLKYSKREILNAIIYLLRTGCSWRHIPHDFPPWRTVYVQFAKWKQSGLFEKMNDILRKKLRQKLGRNEDPSAGVADSQSVKTTEKGASKVSTAGKKLRDENDIYWLILKD
jgi:putative transposase